MRDWVDGSISFSWKAVVTIISLVKNCFLLIGIIHVSNVLGSSCSVSLYI